MTTPIMHRIRRDPLGLYMIRFGDGASPDGEMFGPVENENGPLAAAYTFLESLGHLRITKPLEGRYHPYGYEGEPSIHPVYDVYFASMTFSVFRCIDVGCEASSETEACPC